MADPMGAMHDSFPGPSNPDGSSYSNPMGVTDNFGTGAFKGDEDSAQEQEDFSSENPAKEDNSASAYGRRTDRKGGGTFGFGKRTNFDKKVRS